MKKKSLLTVALFLFISGLVFGAGGDMGASTEPLTNESSDYPYLIEDLTDFDVFANPANSATYWASGVHTKLMVDIDLNPALPGRQTYTTAVIAPDTNVNNSGFQGTSFEGIFNGNNHTISNLTIDTAGARIDYLGLFGKIEGSSAEVKNLGIEGCNITSGDGHPEFLGGLCGYNSGSISNCYATGSLTGGTSSENLGGLCGHNTDGSISNCYATGSVTGGDQSDYLGGLCGENENGTITSCYATNSVTGGDGDASWCLGGLCGGNTGTVSNCYSTGSVTGVDDSWYLGGLCGDNYNGTISNCYSTGSVTGGYDSWYLGGLCGDNTGTVSNCYAAGNVTGTGWVGGLVGRNHNADIFASFWDTETASQGSGVGLIGGTGTVEVYGRTTADMQTQSTFTDYGWDFVGETANGTDDIWRMCIDGVVYPKLYWQYIVGDFVCPDGVNYVDFAFFGLRWLDDQCAGSNDCDGADLDLSGGVGIGDALIFAEHWLEGVVL